MAVGASAGSEGDARRLDESEKSSDQDATQCCDEADGFSLTAGLKQFFKVPSAVDISSRRSTCATAVACFAGLL